jgi:hypothetical protein
VEESKAANMERAKPEDFKVAYPEYYEILVKYSDSKLFRADSADRLSATVNMNLANQTLMSDFGIASIQSRTKNPCHRFGRN